MDKEVALAFIAFLTGLAGIVRWLISVNWDKAKESEDQRHRNEKRTILTLKDSIDDMKKSIETHKKAMASMQEKIEYIHKRLDKSTDELDLVLTTLKKSLDDITSKIRGMESQIITLAKGMVMIKNKVQPSG